ncbi:MAG: DoxX family protein [Chloroflexota bacterium]|nr:DoxX family protein [Chloroflexota bacterium]
MNALFDRFDRVDTAMNRWLVANSIGILRGSIGLVFIAFGLLKFIPGMSPIEGLAGRTAEMISFGLLSPRAGMIVIAVLECAIGLSFITGKFLRVGVWLMGAQMIGAMSPLVLFPGELFSGQANGPTLEAQYIVKDVILIAAGLLIAATWTGARIVAEPRTMRASLRQGAPRLRHEPSALVAPISLEATSARR